MSDSILSSAERHARWVDAAKKIGAGVLFGGGIVVSVVLWLSGRASTFYVDAAEARSVAANKAQAETMRQFGERIIKLETTLDDKEREDSRRWDGLDRVLQKQFGQSILAVPPPSYGPAAKREGRQ